MTYYINPMWFYWINVVKGIKDIVFYIMLLIIIATASCVVIYLINIASINDYPDCSDGERETNKKILKAFKLLIPLIVIFALFLVFIPSKNTLIEMQIAKYATVENAESSVEAVKNAVDYIISAIQEAKG